MRPPPTHGGGLDVAVEKYGGARADWMDLSTGINPIAFELPALAPEIWARLPDEAAFEATLASARAFWNVPDGAEILPVPGLSSVIARLPELLSEFLPRTDVCLCEPTYNEYRQSFSRAKWNITPNSAAPLHIYTHPNNPDGRLAHPIKTRLTIIDESFCDTIPAHSFIAKTAQEGTLILKSFGKFWGLAGLRLGFVIGAPEIARQLKTKFGPWPVSGPALAIAKAAFSDPAWAQQTRARLADNAKRLDALISAKIPAKAHGTSLFRLYESERATEIHTSLCQKKILTRIFPYRTDWVRIGLPGPEKDWKRLERILARL